MFFWFPLELTNCCRSALASLFYGTLCLEFLALSRLFLDVLSNEELVEMSRPFL